VQVDTVVSRKKRKNYLPPMHSQFHKSDATVLKATLITR